MEEVFETEEEDEELEESGKEKLNDFLNKIPQQTIEEICSARSQVSGNKIIINFTYCSQISTAASLILSLPSASCRSRILPSRSLA